MSGFARSRKMRPRMNSPIVTGTSVTDSRLAAAIANVLVNASGLNSRPSCPSSVKTGRNETVMMSSEKKSAGPDFLRRLHHDLPALGRRSASPVSNDRAASAVVARLRVDGALEVLVHVLDHHDRRVDHRADGDGDAAERHDVGADADAAHAR